MDLLDQVGNLIRMEREEDPFEIGDWETTSQINLAQVREYYQAQYRSVYAKHNPATSSPSGTAPARTSAAPPAAKGGNPPLSGDRSVHRPNPPKATESDLDRSWKFMAKTTIYLIHGVFRFMDIGRINSVYIKRYHRQIASYLREGLNLEEVVQPRLKRTRDLLEPDEETVHKRRALKKRQEEFRALRCVGCSCDCSPPLMKVKLSDKQARLD